MNKYNLIIEPADKIYGNIEASGFKHVAVPLIASSLLVKEPILIKNIPCLYEIDVLKECLDYLSCKTLIENHTMKIDTSSFKFNRLPSALIDKTHGTIYLLPALLIRNKFIEIPKNFGGCDLGLRPIENVIYPLKKIGANIRVFKDKITGELNSANGTEIDLSFKASKFDKYVSGATKSTIMATVLAKGSSKITNYFRRAPTKQICEFLNLAGGEIKLGEEEIKIEGVKRLRGAEYVLPPDQIEIFTYICLVGICKGKIRIKNAYIEESFKYELAVLRDAGIDIYEDRKVNEIEVHCFRDLKSINIDTQKFHTDIQPLYSIMVTSAVGRTEITESVWENRFSFVPELIKMGADIKRSKNKIFVEFTPKFEGGIVEGKDLRSTAALILAALKSKKTTKILNAQHLDRGYENIIGKLQGLKIKIKKEEL